MRTVATLLLVVILLTPRALANEKEAREIVERAIKAHGGAAALEKAWQCKRIDTGTQKLLNRDVPFVSEVTRSLPDRVRMQIEFDKRFTSTIVVDDKRGWKSEAGAAAEPLRPELLRDIREELYVNWLTTLTPLTRNEFRLTTIDKIKINGESAVGIRVSRRGYADTRMYFLERNGLLAKIERRVREGGREVDKEYLYSGFKEFGGVVLPTRETVQVNGEKQSEFRISDYSFPEKLGAGTFARP